MKSAVIALLVLFVIVQESESQCITRRTDWGQFGSFFTDPLCDIWCRMRRCGKGDCRENPNTRNTASCVCEKCYKDENGNAVYTNSDDNQNQQYSNQNRQYSNQNQQYSNQNQDYPNIYRGQNTFTGDNNDYI